MNHCALHSQAKGAMDGKDKQSRCEGYTCADSEQPTNPSRVDDDDPSVRVE